MARLSPINLGSPGTISALVAALKRALDPIILQLNDLGDGKAVAVSNAMAAPPASGSTTTYAVGDVIKNSVPAELGAVGAKYIITGWICVAAGTPGVWKECRVLTGS
ncbi:hypothetical protein G3N59_10610 [Paraburkholderia sp. Ac-20340]|uniref:hypothetical protein n=1 Tax=Paraburkholderia sp. Ac-20340 TaxID=2703888 RepID=UPI0019820BFB|nr:hypothetical protein [Paraburkholderia sp. Ac-20340]MBN3853830.1 hypothetical protein [Paraburkholderia sp. Ac-20340]